MEPAFDTKQVQGQFAILQIDSEDKGGAAMPETVRHSEKRAERDLIRTDSAARTSSLGSMAEHASLQRRHSDGAHQYTRPNSLSLPSTTKLPKIPARRLLSDTTESAQHFVHGEDGSSRIHSTRQNFRNQRFPGGDLNATPFPVKMKSLQQESTFSFDSTHARGHHLVTRRRSEPRFSTSRKQRPLSSSCGEASSWQIKKHKRSLNIDDDDSDNSEESWSRKSSSSLGFSSQSSLI